MTGTINSLVGVGFVPTNIAGLLLWVDAADSGSITQVAGAVSQWNDKSGNANNLTQSTGSAQPTIQTAAQNGLNTIRFTGASSQIMVLTQSINIDSAGTVVGVVRRGGPAGTNHVAILGASGAPSGGSFLWYGADTHIYNKNSSGYFDANPQAATTYTVVHADLTGSTGNVYINGSSVVGSYISNSGVAATFDRFGWNNAIYCNGEIAEVVVYNSVLSATNRSLIQTYLKTKWGTP